MSMNGRKVIARRRVHVTTLTTDLLAQLAWAAKEDAVTASVKAFAEGLSVITPTQRTTRLTIALGTFKNGASNFMPSVSTDASLPLTRVGQQLNKGDYGTVPQRYEGGEETWLWAQ
jgi:hypothetical protein